MIVGWAVLAVLFAATTTVESMSWNQLTAYAPLYLREIGVPPAQVPSWIAAMSSLGWILALPLAPFWGVPADRYSRKAVIVRSAVAEAVRTGHVTVLSATSIGSAIALAIVGASRSLPVFAMALLINGVFAAAILTASMAVMSATVSPERRGAVLGQILFPFYIGGVIGPLIGGAAFGVGQRLVFGVAALLSLAPLIVMVTMRPARQATPA